MPCHSESRIVPYTPRQMFDLVADIERYPAFLPWCRDVRILSRDDAGVITARMTAGTQWLQDDFTSYVMLEPHRRISVRYGGGALAHLHNEWRFDKVRDPSGGRRTACRIGFDVDFAFRARLLNMMMEGLFDRAFRKMVYAFEQRAEELYA